MLSKGSAFEEGTVESCKGCGSLGESSEDGSEGEAGFSVTVGIALWPVAGRLGVSVGAGIGVIGFLENSGLPIMELSWGGAEFV